MSCVSLRQKHANDLLIYFSARLWPLVIACSRESAPATLINEKSTAAATAAATQPLLPRSWIRWYAVETMINGRRSVSAAESLRHVLINASASGTRSFVRPLEGSFELRSASHAWGHARLSSKQRLVHVQREQQLAKICEQTPWYTDTYADVYGFLMLQLLLLFLVSYLILIAKIWQR